MSVRGLTVRNSEWAKVDIDRAWDVIIPVDIPSIFTGLPPLIPAVTSTEDQSGPWDAAGQTRRFKLADGNETAEVIDAVDRPHSFNYTVGPFSGPLGSLVKHAKGEFVFEPMGGGTHIRWTYDWASKPGAQPIIWVLARVWNVYAKRMLYKLARLAED